jgi:predicted transposase/invertase (TIGR01784 family)
MKITNSQPPERLDPLNDYLFFKVMGEKGDETQLLGFLNAVLGRTGNDRLASVEILENKTFSAQVIGDKTSILDVRAALQDGTMINIEVQLRNLRNMDRRSLFYCSREFTKGLDAAMNYRELPNVIAINIVNFEFLNVERFHTVFHLREDHEPDVVLTNALEIHVLDMVKWRKQGNKDIASEPLHRWLMWFDHASPAELVAEVVSMDGAIREAEERQAYVSMDKDALRLYEMRQKAQWDFNSYIDDARQDGIAEGVAKGVAQEKLENARKMKAMGILPDQIQAITGLSSQAIQTL